MKIGEGEWPQVDRMPRRYEVHLCEHAEDLHMFVKGSYDLVEVVAERIARGLQMRIDTWRNESSQDLVYSEAVKTQVLVALEEFRQCKIKSGIEVGNNCPHCGRAYRFQEEAAADKCAVCVSSELMFDEGLKKIGDKP